jgi:allantoin racemase
VLVLGCAGMAQYRHRVEQAIGLPVVDPTQAAVTMAIGAVRLATADAADPGLQAQASARPG